MTSQGPGLEILERIAEWSSEEIQSNIDNILSELLSYLTGDDKGLALQSVYTLLVTCLPSLSLDEADRILLQHAMPAAEMLFRESMEGIKLRLDDGSHPEEMSDTLSSLLQVCIEIIKCMECVLQFIISQGNINISGVPSVPKVVASVMLQTFRHCKESEALYKDVFSAVADVLGTIFRQCHQVQCLFFAALTSSISFDCSVETDILYLVDVLQILAEVGEHIMSLDVKTMAEQWKGYAKVIQIYLEPLRQHLNIGYPIGYLCTEIEKNLEHLTYQIPFKDAKSITRLLKTTSFVLKFVVKLCEQFGSGNGCLGDCQESLFQLLLTLHRYSRPSLTIQQLDENLIDDIERHLIVASDPLLSHLVCEDAFRKEFFKKIREACQGPNDHLQYILLTLSIIKKLTVANEESRDVWLDDEKTKNIIGCLLELLKFAHCELSSHIWFPAVVKAGESPRKCDLYEALCCHCAGLVLLFNSDQFQKVETMFLDSLLEPFIWPSLLSGDVWCICARAGSSELVLEQTLYLAEVLSSFEISSINERTELKSLSLFLKRMCSFLSTKGKQSLIDRFPPSDNPSLWLYLGLGCLSKETKLVVAQELIVGSKTSIEDFLNSNLCVSSFTKMISSLCGLNAALESLLPRMLSNDDQCRTVVPSMISLWEYVFQCNVSEYLISSNHCGKDTRWIQRLIEILSKCTEYAVHFMNNAEIRLVLICLDGLTRCHLCAMKLSVIGILRGLATKVLDVTPDQAYLCSKIANLFSLLLEDSNPIVKESVLEAFEYFAHFTIHENIVAEAVADSKSIQETVSSYLQKEYPATEPSSKLLDHLAYLRLQASVPCTHKCTMKKAKISPPKIDEKPAKKFKLDCDSTDLSAFLADDFLNEFVEKDVTEAVERISNDAMYLVSHCSVNALPVSSRECLRKAVDNLKKFVSS